MSAWLVTDTHINVIVQSMIVEDLLSVRRSGQIRRLMKWMNHRALHVRYGNELPDLTEVELVDETVEAPLDDAVVRKSLTCWEYQCAEYDWADAEEPVVLLATQLRERLDARNPRGYDNDPNLPFGLDSWDQAIDHRHTPPEPTPDAHLDDVGD